MQIVWTDLSASMLTEQARLHHLAVFHNTSNGSYSATTQRGNYKPKEEMTQEEAEPNSEGRITQI